VNENRTAGQRKTDGRGGGRILLGSDCRPRQRTSKEFSNVIELNCVFGKGLHKRGELNRSLSAVLNLSTTTGGVKGFNKTS